MTTAGRGINRAAALERLVAVMEELRADRLDTLETVYAPQARFVDPFNAVEGVPAIRGIFAHGFRQCPGMRFSVTARAVDGDHGLLRWRMRCGEEPGALVIEGMTEVVLADDGRVLLHVDHWDPAAQIYERVPLLGWLLRRIRRRLAVPRD
ncbi:MAG: nuclear transport factor 2 family protein [Guyparkeria sp.]|uniref:nuclear transport factor 2 family protein n=1 Tax=Guyparkeria sp. TaxID=2035736 RepID=UPI00397BE72F